MHYYEGLVTPKDMYCDVMFLDLYHVRCAVIKSEFKTKSDDAMSLSEVWYCNDYSLRKHTYVIYYSYFTAVKR